MNATVEPRPHCIPRTGETELCNAGNILDRHSEKLFYATEKLDGFSFSFGWVKDEFVGATRDRVVRLDEDTAFGTFLRSFPFRDLPDGYIFQGELVGPGVRSNRYNLDGLKLYVFDVIKDGARMDFDEARAVAGSFRLDWVPVIAEGFHANRLNVLPLATGFSKIGDVAREGAVFRTMTETEDEFQGRVSFKVFNPDYPWHH